MNEIRSFCEYLECLNMELDSKMRKTAKDVEQLHKIYKALVPKQDTQPKDDERVADVIRKARGYSKPVITVEAKSQYDVFLDLLQQYNSLEKLHIDRLPNRFLSRCYDLTRMTAAHLYERMIPGLRLMNSKLDEIDPSQRFKAVYTLKRIEDIAKKYESLINSYSLLKIADSTLNEKNEVEVLPPKKNESTQAKQFETVGSFTPRQLNALYELRGSALTFLMQKRIKTRAADVFIPYLSHPEQEEDKLNYLKVASLAFKLFCREKPAIITEQ